MIRGRFAPSPTGPLHFGSLVAATASFLAARAGGGAWHLRIDDLDPPREAPGAAASIQRTLERCGFEWVGPVQFQSRRQALYAEHVERLLAADEAFPCGCTRREVGPGPYPGTCARGLPAGRRARSVRVRAHTVSIRFEDTLQGEQHIDLARTDGDFIIRRADGLFGYHLACVVDDAALGITDIVRGADLLESTANQLLLTDRIGFARPTYTHVPVVLDGSGEKLSKHSRARPVDDIGHSAALWHALDFLGHEPPPGLARAAPSEILAWGLEHWHPAKVPHLPARAYAALDTAPAAGQKRADS